MNAVRRIVYCVIASAALTDMAGIGNFTCGVAIRRLYAADTSREQFVGKWTREERERSTIVTIELGSNGRYTIITKTQYDKVAALIHRIYKGTWTVVDNTKVRLVGDRPSPQVINLRPTIDLKDYSPASGQKPM